jgi:tetratricopeptide (TPR) repeat protein
LKEYNARWKDAIETNRVEVIPALAQIASIAPPIVAEPGFFRKLILWVHDPDQRALAKCRYELAEREAELRVLTTSKVRCRAEVVTAHLTLGSRLAKVASHGGQSAVKAYEKAFGVNKTDLDTLELMAKQQFALGFEDQAFDCLDKLAEVASNASDQLRHARARRYQSEILLASESSSDWDRARANLVALIRALNGTDAIDLSKKLLELAFAHELLTKVQITREKFTAARTELKAAALLFRRIGAPDGPEGLERLEALSKELDEAEKDKDNPDVPD